MWDGTFRTQAKIFFDRWYPSSCSVCLLIIAPAMAHAAIDPPPPKTQLQTGDWDFASIQPLKPYKSPWKAVSLACLSPGLGHLYLQEYRTAIGLSLGSGILAGIHHLDPGDALSTLVTLQNLASYNIYAAYRDARALNDQMGYCYAMPAETLFDLALAPFHWSILKKPEVWGGLIAALAAVTAIATFGFEGHSGSHTSLSASGEIFPLTAFPIAIGEEAFFRGFLQSACYEHLGPVGSMIISSLAFGAAHIPNAYHLERSMQRGYFLFSLPMITALGGYFGYLSYTNRSLKEATAIHAWYDCILFASAYAAQAKLSTRPSCFGLSIPF